MGIMLWDGKVLFRQAYGSKIAADPNCCCWEDSRTCQQIYDAIVANGGAVSATLTLDGCGFDILNDEVVGSLGPSEASPVRANARVGTYGTTSYWTFYANISCLHDEDGVHYFRLEVYISHYVGDYTGTCGYGTDFITELDTAYVDEDGNFTFEHSGTIDNPHVSNSPNCPSFCTEVDFDISITNNPLP